MIFPNCRAHPNVVIEPKIMHSIQYSDILSQICGEWNASHGVASAMWKFLQDYVAIAERTTMAAWEDAQLQFMLSGLTDWGIWASRP